MTWRDLCTARLCGSLLAHCSTASNATAANPDTHHPDIDQGNALLLRPAAHDQAFFPVGFAFVFSLRFRASM